MLFPVGLKHVDGVLGASHVRALGDELGTGGHQGLGLLLADLILGRARQRDVDLADVDPRAGAVEVLVPALVLEGRQRLALHLEIRNGLHVLGRHAVALLGHDGALGVGQRHDGRAELDALERGVLRHVAGPGDGHSLAGPAASPGEVEHVADVVDETVACRLCRKEKAKH